MFGNDSLLSEILVTLVVSFFVITAFVGIALGIGLNVSSARTLRFLKTMNRWVATPERLKVMDKPHDIDEPTNRRRRWSGTVFTLGGAYTVFMLLFVVEYPYVVVALSQYAKPVVVELLVDSLRWFLLLGGVFAFVVGVMMLISPRAIPALGSRLNRWYSTDKLAKVANEMHMSLDNLAESYPRATGLVLAFLSAFALIAAMIVWVGR
ncbi:MAG: hypothetical protein JSU95_10305 [Betaproteobacteria bacterium]|nr:MAG: hypothetical protein JSU95_10305 [Betaproteobacteria bacterium]